MAFNILLVDDSRTVRAMLTKTLQLAQIPINELHEAGNGEEGLAVLEDQWIDLVFVDINMPVMGGIEMIEKMREDDMLKTTPVIVCSTEGSEPRIEQLKAMGIHAYFRKPFKPEEVREAVSKLVEADDAE